MGPTTKYKIIIIIIIRYDWMYLKFVFGQCGCDLFKQSYAIVIEYSPR